MGFFSKLKFGLKLTADSTKARLALPVCIETAKKVQCNAAQLRVIKREAALLGAPDTFLDALRRIIESFESVGTTNVEAACACQAVVNATDEKQIDLARTSQRGSRQTPKYSTPMGEAYDDFKLIHCRKPRPLWVTGVS